MDGHALWPGPGEWVRADVLMSAHSDYVVVCPKTQPLEWWSHDLPRGVTTLSSPYPADPRLTAMLRTSTATAPIVFVGDMDPVAIAQYLAARTELRKRNGPELLYGGISDSWMTTLRRFLRRRWNIASLRIRLERAETLLWHRLEAAVDVDQLLGPEGSGLLRSGYKIELEAVSNPSISTVGYRRWVFNHLRFVATARRQRK